MNLRILGMIFLLLVVPVQVNARLVIIQDDAVLAEREKQAEEKAIADERAAKLREKQLAEEMRIRAVEDATVDFREQEFNVIADRTERIIKHFGIPPKQLPAIGGGALDSPFWVAMNSITPHGWKVFTDKAIDAHAPVTWSGQNRNWIALLHQFGVEKRITFDVDWNQKILLLRPRASSIDYLREEHKQLNGTQDFIITVDTQGEQLIPEGGEGVLVINGEPVKVKRAERLMVMP